MRFHRDFQGLENWTTEADVLAESQALGIEPDFDCTPVCEFLRRIYVSRLWKQLWYQVFVARIQKSVFTAKAHCDCT